LAALSWARASPGRLGEQSQRRLEHDQPVLRRFAGVASHRRRQRAAVHRIQRAKVVRQGLQELGETGEFHPGSEFTARYAQDLQADGLRGFFRRIQERGLADARLASEQQRPALGRDLLEEGGDERQFLVTSHEV